MAPPQQPLVQDFLGINLDYMLPHQREQYRRHLANMNDLQSRKTKEPNSTQLDVAINEARNQLTQLAYAAAQNERQYPTPELFAQYLNQYQQSLQQRRADISNPSSVVLTPDKLRAVQTGRQQLANRLKEIEAVLNKPEVPEETKIKLRKESQTIIQQLEKLQGLLQNNQPPARIAAATTTNQLEASMIAGPNQPTSPPTSQTQPPTPTIRNISSAPQVSIQQSSQSGLPPAASMGQLPRPSVNISIPPARPTLTGGYPVGTPLLGTASPAGIPHAFHLAQDGEARLLSKRKLQDLVKSIDPDERLEPDVEELLMEVADEFIESVLQQSCKIARHRKGQMLEVRDVQLHLERNWNIRIPGYSSEEVRSVKKYNPTQGHVAKIGAVSQSKAMTKD